VKATINASTSHAWRVMRDGGVAKHFVDGTRVR
jgi:hypothetical protein